MANELIKMKSGLISDIEKNEQTGVSPVPIDAGTIYFAVDGNKQVGKILYDVDSNNRVVMSTQAEIADAANITSTKYGVSYYTNNTGTFASTTAGTAGQVFISSGPNAAPGWKSFTTAVINTGYALTNPGSLSASVNNEVLTLTASTVQLTSSGTTDVLTGVTGVAASYANGNGVSY